eukprot:scaffold39139_cov182-Skeletonema_marinoi.AAC.5
MSAYLGPGIFWVAIAECSEALGETSIAHKSYVKLKNDDDFYDYEDNESLFCKNVMPGAGAALRAAR